jgi:DNA-binding transcriptional MerR regulator
MSIWRYSVRLRHYRRILAVVLLVSFWTIRVYGEPQTTPPEHSNGSGTRRYSESEVDTLIEELTGAAHGAIEQAAGEAARAASLASLERELSLLQAKALAVREAERLQEENGALRKGRVKTAIITGVVCFFEGLAIGVGGVVSIGGR